MRQRRIRLTREQTDALPRIASDSGVPVDDLIDQAMQRLSSEWDRRSRIERALSVVGKFRDVEGARDVATRHDHYLAEAFDSHS